MFIEFNFAFLLALVVSRAATIFAKSLLGNIQYQVNNDLTTLPIPKMTLSVARDAVLSFLCIVVPPPPST